jgi:hypothetical protein
VKSRRNIAIVIILFDLFIFAGCAAVTGENGGDESKTDTEYEQVLTLSDFTEVQIGMKFDDVVKCVGSPTGSQGSGLIWQIYQLCDGSYMQLFFGSEDSLVSMSIVDPDGREFELKQVR